MEYINYIFYGLVIAGIALIYNKVSKKNDTSDLKDDLDLERERKEDLTKFKDQRLLLGDRNISSTIFFNLDF